MGGVEDTSSHQRSQRNFKPSEEVKDISRHQMESKTLHVVTRSRRHSALSEGVKNSVSQELKAQLITRSQSQLGFNHKSIQRLNYIWAEGSSYYKKELPKELRILHERT